ncbi:hypothetical protein [Streptomyces sp. Je 1-369]|uniref:hypothetical protein n=1 Tax=Streptomyces sp. Je 1-369 TaxID=2966192 RepID=UPI002285F49E|nr:hypothetical protein [Streptomyces sp. Je 1-369]WAL94025.1 hypothetical protein NOO62_05625 [Streptomyces sp. Je 1-369]
MSETLYARVRAATADTSYRLQRTGRGFDMTVDVPQVGRNTTQVHTYRVELHPREKTFTMTDIIRTQERGAFGTSSHTVERGRAGYRTWGRSLDGSERTSFSSADGHRLIRGAAQELGWEELRPASEKTALIAGAIGGLIAVGTLIACAVVFLL